LVVANFWAYVFSLSSARSHSAVTGRKPFRPERLIAALASLLAKRP
jgi:hypothetical protein